MAAALDDDCSVAGGGEADPPYVANPNLFAGISFYVDEGVNPPALRLTLIEILSTHGAEALPPSTSKSGHRRFDLPPPGSDQKVVVVTESLAFPEWSTDFEGRRDDGRWVATPKWVLQSLKSDIRYDTAYFSPDPMMYFSGVCVCCSELLSQGDRQAIAAGVHASGGQSKTFLTKEVTHFITPSASGEMYELLIGPVAAGAKIEAVLPHWVDACLSLGMLVDTRPYAFPNPPIQEHPAAAKPLPTGTSTVDFVPKNHQDLLAQMAAKENNEPTASPMPAAATVWRGRKLRFSEDLDVDLARRESWTEAVRRRGGEVVDHVEEADILICRWRDGRDYNQAIKHGKTVGSVSWYMHVSSVGALSSPTAKLLHYPFPKDTIPDFNSVCVTLTNYTGETRDYVRTLVELMGGRFTPDFSRANTHVIASVLHGNKVARAAAWEKPVVNHLWVEACFAAWRLLPIHAKPQFTQFNTGVNMVTLVGKRGLEVSELRRWIERAENATDLDEEDPDHKSGVRPRYTAALNPPLIPQRPPGQPLSLVTSGAAPSFVAASYDQTSPVQDGRSTGKPSPVPSPLRTTTNRKAVFTGPSSSSAQLAPPSSSKAADLVSSDDPLAIHSGRSPTLRRARQVVSPAPANSASAAIRPASPGKGRLVSRRAATPPPADDPLSSHTGRSKSSSPEHLPQAALKPDLAQVAAEPVAATAGPSRAPASPPRGKAIAASIPLSATPQLECTRHGTAPSSTPRGLDDTAVLPPNSRRRAAEAANKRLHDEIMPDLLDYEKAKRNKTLMTGGRARRSESTGPSERGSSPDKAASGSAGNKGKGKVTAPVEEDDINTDGGFPIDEDEVKVELRRPRSTTNGRKTAAGPKRKLDLNGSEGESDAVTTLKGTKPSAGKMNPKPGEHELVDAPSTHKGKRARSMTIGSSTVDPSKILLLTTQVSLTAAQQKWLKTAGHKSASKPTQCTHLVASGISRTEKFLCALAAAPIILDKSWLEASARAKQFVDPTAHLLVDPEAEARYGIKLANVLARAEAYKTGSAGQVGLLQGITFYATRQVETEFDVLKRIVESHKGKLSATIPRFKTFTDDPTHHVLISCPPDRELWKPLKDQGVGVYTRELILGGLIRQEMDFTKDLLD